MSDNELILAISEIFDKKLIPLEERMSRVENRMDGLEASLNDRMDSLESSLNSRMDGLEQRVRGIELILENDIRRDIRTLAENYLSVSRRYEDAANKYESLEADMHVVKKVVKEHSEKLQKIS